MSEGNQENWMEESTTKETGTKETTTDAAPPVFKSDERSFASNDRPSRDDRSAPRRYEGGRDRDDSYRRREDDRPRRDDDRPRRDFDDRRDFRRRDYEDRPPRRDDDRPRRDYDDRAPRRDYDDRPPRRQDDSFRRRDEDRNGGRDYRDERSDRFDRGRDYSGEDRRRRFPEDDYAPRPRKVRIDPVEPNVTLGMFNLSYDITEDELTSFINEKCPEFVNKYTCKPIMDRETGRCKGYGFITFETLDDSIKAKSLLDGGEFKGQQYRVAFSIQRPPMTRDYSRPE